jgi:peptidyl-prolyl cis-trans isomerase SurA
MMPSRTPLPFAALIAIAWGLPAALAQSPLALPAPAAAAATPAAQALATPDIADNGVAAIVENRVITFDEVKREVMDILPVIQQEVMQAGGTQQDFNNQVDQMVVQIVQNFIDRELVIKEFRKVTPGQPVRQIPSTFIDGRISEMIAGQFDNDRSKYVAWLMSRQMTQIEHRTEVEEQIIFQYMLQEQRKSQSVISPVRIETYYRENLEQFRQPDRVHMRLLQLNREAGETDDQLRTRLASLVGRVRAGESFADLARNLSQDLTKKSQGGDWGWVEPSMVAAEFIEPLFALRQGDVTDPIVRGNFGFLLYAEAREFAGIQPLDEVRNQIEGILTQEINAAEERRWLERLRRTGYVRLFL